MQEVVGCLSLLHDFSRLIHFTDIWSLGLSLITLATGHFPLPVTGGYWGILAALNNSETELQLPCSLTLPSGLSSTVQQPFRRRPVLSQNADELSETMSSLLSPHNITHVSSDSAQFFSSPNAPPVDFAFSPQFRDFVQRCLCIDPEKRPSSLQLLVSASFSGSF